MKSKIIIFAFISFTMVLLAQPVRSDIIWEEKFDTSLSSDWSITHGDVEVINGALEGTDCVDYGQIGFIDICSAAIWVNSTAWTGTWSVDYFMSSTKNSSFLFYFVAQGASSTSGAWPAADYMAFFWGTDFLEGKLYGSISVTIIMMEMGIVT